MVSLDDIAAAGLVYRSARFAGWAVIGLMILTLVYALAIAVTNWSQIGV